MIIDNFLKSGRQTSNFRMLFTPVESTSIDNMSFFLFSLSLPFLQQQTRSVKSLLRSPFWSQSVRQVGPTGRTWLPAD